MGIEDGTTEFKLTKPIEYRLNGSAELSDTVLLREPCMDHVKHYLKLKQFIMRAQMELATQITEINELRDSIGEEIKPLNQEVENLEQQAAEIAPAIGLALQAAKSVAIDEFIGTFETMACMKARKPIALLNGQQALTQSLWSTLRVDDAFNMAVWWCSFFAMPSDVQGKTTSVQQSESHTGRTVA